MDLSRVLQVASLTHPGRIRSLNEDCVLARPSSGIVLLADGMGGYKAGEVASGMAVEVIGHGLETDWRRATSSGYGRDVMRSLAQKLVAQHIERANTAIFERALADAECQGMGTTLVMGLFHDDALTVAHIGDSRMYRLRGESLEQVTRDHSLLQEQIDSGILTPEQARLSLNKNLVTRALGVDEIVEAEIRTYAVEPGDIYLLCSDGLNDMVDDEDIRAILLGLQGRPDMAAEHLVQAANDGGGRDNVSVVVVRVASRFAVDNGWLVKLKCWFNR